MELTFGYLVVCCSGASDVKFLENFNCKPGLLLWGIARSLSLEAFKQW